MLSAPLFDYPRLFLLLLPVAGLFVGVALVSLFSRSGSPGEQLRGFVQIVAVVAFLAHFDQAVQATKSAVNVIVHDGLQATPEDVLQKFAQKLLASEDTGEEGGFWSKVTKLGTHLFHAFLAGIITFSALGAMAIVFLAYVLQETALELGIALAPLFVGFLLLQSTRSVGVQFLLYMLAVALFPIGWGAASLVSDQLIDFATTHQLVQGQDTGSSLSYAMRQLLGALVLSAWLVLSTLIAPFAMIRAVTSGVHLSSDAVKSARSAVQGWRS